MSFRFFIQPCLFLFLISVLFSPASGQKVDIEVKTKTYGGGKAPRHAVAIWIQTPETKLVKTIEVWSWQYNFCLKNWRTITGLFLEGSYDAICQATVPNHDDPLKVVWDCKDSAGNYVPHGTYEFCAEFAENEYYFKFKDSNEVYTGKYTKGTIEIDSTGKVAEGDVSDNSFEDFSATHYPDAGIVLQAQNPGSNAFFTYRYSPETQNVAIKLNTQFERSAVVYITTLKGEVLETFPLGNGSREFYWHTGSGFGKTIPSGVYLLYVRSSGPEKQLQKGYSITLLK